MVYRGSVLHREGNKDMKKLIGLMIVGSLAGCSYSPVVDLRASGDRAQEFQRDVAECKDLAKNVTLSWSMGFSRIVDQCLRGRGHSVLNVQ